MLQNPLLYFLTDQYDTWTEKKTAWRLVVTQWRTVSRFIHRSDYMLKKTTFFEKIYSKKTSTLTL